jgi:hypothetical protein
LCGGSLIASFAFRVRPSVGVPLALAVFVLASSSGGALVLLGGDAELASRKDDLLKKLPEARKAWHASKVRARAEREARRQKEAAQRQRAVDRAEDSRESTPRWLNGDDSFRLEVVGESHYQRELERVCGGRTEEGEDRLVSALLFLEDSNPYDPNAVWVVIAREKVGHLSRRDATAFRARLKAENIKGRKFPCRANIRGGWDRCNGDKGNFGVWLDVCLYQR